MATTLHARSCCQCIRGAAGPKTSSFLRDVGDGKVPKAILKVQCPAYCFSSWNRSARGAVCSSVFNLNLLGCMSTTSLSKRYLGARSTSEKQSSRRRLRSVYRWSAVLDTAQEALAETPQADSSLDRLAYEVRIETSRAAGSGLSILEGGVLVALIGTAGRFELKTLNTSSGDSQASGNFDVGGSLETHFQGASIGAIESLLLSPANGTWRPARASVLVKQVSLKESSQVGTHTAASEGPHTRKDVFQDERTQENQSHVKEVTREGNESEGDTNRMSPVLYTFVWNDGLIGENCEESAAELVPESVQTGDIASQGLSNSSTPEDLVALRASGLAEYEELKLFLLGCTAGLVGVGTLGSKLVFGDDVSIGFALGGTAGLLYLLLLERTVDQIGESGIAIQEGDVASKKAESQALGLSEGPLDRILNRIAILAKGPASRLVLVALLALIGAKVLGGGELRSLEPRQILGGLFGFLVYKVAVILAAFRPVDAPSKG